MDGLHLSQYLYIMRLKYLFLPTVKIFQSNKESLVNLQIKNESLILQHYPLSSRMQVPLPYRRDESGIMLQYMSMYSKPSTH